MAELMTIARPYADAIFSLCNQHTTGPWSDMLAYLAAMVENPEMRTVVTHPHTTPQQVADLIIDIVNEQHAHTNSPLPTDIKPFIEILAEYHRLPLLPEIAKQFKHLQAELEDVVEAKVETAFKLTAEQHTALANALSKHYSGKTVRLEVYECPELIGGVRVKVGDKVIDASVRGKLHTMAASLKN